MASIHWPGWPSIAPQSQPADQLPTPLTTVLGSSEKQTKMAISDLVLYAWQVVRAQQPEVWEGVGKLRGTLAASNPGLNLSPHCSS